MSIHELNGQEVECVICGSTYIRRFGKLTCSEACASERYNRKRSEYWKRRTANWNKKEDDLASPTTPDAGSDAGSDAR